MGEDNEEESEPKVVDEQGILLFNIFDMTKNRSSSGIKNTIAGSDDVSVASAGYKNQLTSDGSQPQYKAIPNICLIDTTNPSTFLNILKSDTRKNDILMRLSTFELSSLVPLIRIFKVFHNPFTKKNYTLELPFDTAASGIKNIFDSGVGRGDGVGLQSVEWRQVPKNEAAVSIYTLVLSLHMQSIDEFFKTRNFMVTDEGVSLYASVEDLLYQRKEMRKATNEGTGVFNTDSYTIKMIVGWQISDEGLQSLKSRSTAADVDALLDALREQKDVLYLTLKSHDIQFNEDGSVGLQINYIGRTDANSNDIDKANVLSPGAGYEAEIDLIRNTITDLESQNSDLALEDVKQKEGRSGLRNFVDDTDARDKIQNNESTIEDLKKKLEEMKQGSKKAKYNYYVKRMIEKKQVHIFTYKTELLDLLTNLNGLSALTKPTNIKTIEERNKYLQNAAGTAFEGSQQTEELNLKTLVGGQTQATQTVTVEQMNDAKSSVWNSVKNFVKDVAGGGPTAKEFEQPMGADVAGTIALERFGAQASTFDEVSDANNEFIETVAQGDLADEGPFEYGAGIRRFPYFYLSSLIDALMEPIMNLNKKNPNFINKETRVILGPLTLVDYGSLVDTGKIYKVVDQVDEKKTNYVKVYTGKQMTVNIGDIPISLKEFTKWFNEEIVNKNIEQMVFSEFISSIINNLVFKSLTNEIYTYAPKQKARLAIDSFTAVVGAHNESVFLKNAERYTPHNLENLPFKIKPEGGGFRVGIGALESLKTKAKDCERDHLSYDDPNYLPNKDYVIIYCINNTPYERVGDYDDDLKNGILHFYAGSSKGTIRNLKFSRSDNARAATVNILANTNEGKGVSKIIREKYNVSLELFGNTSIQAGTYIFLSPMYPGSGRIDPTEPAGGGAGVVRTEKRLRDIGLGGYYLVTEVANSIESGDFKTSLKAIWSAFADGTVNDGEREYAELDPRSPPTMGILT